MIQAHPDQGHHMVIFDRVIHDFAVSSILHDFHGPQEPQLVRHGGIRLIAQHRDVTHTMFSVQQGQDDFQAGRVTQGLENVHHPADVFVTWQGLLRLSHLVFMNAFHITDIHLSPQNMNILSYDKLKDACCQPGFPKIKAAGAVVLFHTRDGPQPRCGLTEWDETCI
jgi:hypothetical protein